MSEPFPSDEHYTGKQRPDSFIHLRVTRRQKASYVRAAESAGKNLTDWATGAMDASAELQTALRRSQQIKVEHVNPKKERP